MGRFGCAQEILWPLTFWGILGRTRAKVIHKLFEPHLVRTWCCSGADKSSTKKVWAILACAIHKLKILRLSADLVRTGEFLKGVWLTSLVMTSMMVKRMTYLLGDDHYDGQENDLPPWWWLVWWSRESLTSLVMTSMMVKRMTNLLGDDQYGEENELPPWWWPIRWSREWFTSLVMTNTMVKRMIYLLGDDQYDGQENDLPLWWWPEWW